MWEVLINSVFHCVRLCIALVISIRLLLVLLVMAVLLRWFLHHRLWTVSMIDFTVVRFRKFLIIRILVRLRLAWGYNGRRGGVKKGNWWPRLSISDPWAPISDQESIHPLAAFHHYFLPSIIALSINSPSFDSHGKLVTRAIDFGPANPYTITYSSMHSLTSNPFFFHHSFLHPSRTKSHFSLRFPFLLGSLPFSNRVAEVFMESAESLFPLWRRLLLGYRNR